MIGAPNLFSRNPVYQNVTATEDVVADDSLVGEAVELEPSTANVGDVYPATSIWYNTTTGTLMLGANAIAMLSETTGSSSANEILYNSAGSVAGDPVLLWDDVNHRMIAEKERIAYTDGYNIECESITNATYNKALTFYSDNAGVAIPIYIGHASVNVDPNAYESIFCGMRPNFLGSGAFSVRTAKNEGFISGTGTSKKSHFRALLQSGTISASECEILGFNTYINAGDQSTTVQDGVGFALRNEITGSDAGICFRACESTDTEPASLPLRMSFPAGNDRTKFHTEVRIDDDTDAGSVTTGCLSLKGGLSVAKKLYINSELIAPNLPTSDSAGHSLVMYKDSTDKVQQINSIPTGAFGNPLYYSSASNRIYDNTSSERYKENITTITDFSDYLLDVRLVTFRMREMNEFDKNENDKKTFTGVIAEELFALNPESIEYSHLTDAQVEENNWQDYVLKRTETFPGKPNKVVNAPRQDYLLYSLIEQNKKRKAEIDDLKAENVILTDAIRQLETNFINLQADFVALSESVNT